MPSISSATTLLVLASAASAVTAAAPSASSSSKVKLSAKQQKLMAWKKQNSMVGSKEATAYGVARFFLSKAHHHDEPVKALAAAAESNMAPKNQLRTAAEKFGDAGYMSISDFSASNNTLSECKSNDPHTTFKHVLDECIEGTDVWYDDDGDDAPAHLAQASYMMSLVSNDKDEYTISYTTYDNSSCVNMHETQTFYFIADDCIDGTVFDGVDKKWSTPKKGFTQILYGTNEECVDEDKGAVIASEYLSDGCHSVPQESFSYDMTCDQVAYYTDLHCEDPWVLDTMMVPDGCFNVNATDDDADDDDKFWGGNDDDMDWTFDDDGGLPPACPPLTGASDYFQPCSIEACFNETIVASLCEDGGYYHNDPKIALTDANGFFLAINDDYCGLGSQITYKTTTTEAEGCNQYILVPRCWASATNCGGRIAVSPATGAAVDDDDFYSGDDDDYSYDFDDDDENNDANDDAFQELFDDDRYEPNGYVGFQCSIKGSSAAGHVAAAAFATSLAAVVGAVASVW